MWGAAGGGGRAPAPRIWWDKKLRYLGAYDTAEEAERDEQEDEEFEVMLQKALRQSRQLPVPAVKREEREVVRRKRPGDVMKEDADFEPEELQKVLLQAHQRARKRPEREVVKKRRRKRNRKYRLENYEHLIFKLMWREVANIELNN